MSVNLDFIPFVGFVSCGLWAKRSCWVPTYRCCQQSSRRLSKIVVVRSMKSWGRSE